MEGISLNTIIPVITVNDVRATLPEKEHHRDTQDNRSQGSRASNETLDSKFISKNFNLRKLSSCTEKSKRKDSSLYSRFTALPHFKAMDDKTPIKMINLPSKGLSLSKYIVAPDGFIPNSIIREKYPPLFIAAPTQQKRKKKKRILGEEEDYIKKILYKHLAPDKIKEVKIRSTARAVKARKKPHYEYVPTDLLAIQNDVVDNFNFELENATSEKVTDDTNIGKTKRKKQKPVTALAANVLKTRTTKMAMQDEILGRMQSVSTEIEEIEDEIEDEIDIDILDKLEKQIEDYERIGGLVSNEKVSQRILKDRRYRIDDVELKKWLDYLELTFDSKEEMYRQIRKALNKDEEAQKLLEIHIVSRQTRLGFLNTLTDPQHIFKYFLNFFGNKSDLLDCIQDVLGGADKSNLKQLLYFCGEHYKLQEFFSEFVGVKNYVLNVLATKISSEKERVFAFEKCLRDGIINDDIVFGVFMSSEADAKMFFELIPQCRLKEMTNIIKHMKEIQEVQRILTKKVTAKDSLDVVSLEPEKPVPTALPRKEMRIEKPATVVLPPLPEYNEHSWKKMMSKYIANMLSTITTTDIEEEKAKRFFEDESLLGLIKELASLHTEVLKLLKVYLNNDEANATKLLGGLIAEDDLAYQALIELIGEKEAMQIIKSLRLKQAKMIGKIIEAQTNEEHSGEAKTMLRSMLHYLPESLSKNLNVWLEAGQVTAADISEAVKILSRKLSPGGQDRESSIQDFFHFTMDDWKSRPSISVHYSSELEVEAVKGPLKRMSIMNTSIDFEYRDLVDREKVKEGLVSNMDAVSFNESVRSISSPQDPTKLKDDKQSTDVSLVSDKYTMKTKSEIIEARVCEDICNIPWFTADPTSHFDDVMFKIADLIKESEDIQNTHEMATIIINIAERTSDKQVKEAVARKLVEHAITLLVEDDEEQETWMMYTEQDTIDEMYLEKIERGTVQPQNIDIQEIRNINIDRVIKPEQSQNFEAAIKRSYYKHMKVKKIIEILKKIEIKKGEELEKVIKNKTHICPLFLPEFTEQINAVRNLGVEYFEPYELVSSSANVIIRKNKEEIKRHAIKSKRAEVDEKRTLTQKSIEKLKDIITISSEMSITGKDMYSIDTTDILQRDSLPFVVVKHSTQQEPEDPDKISDVKTLAVTYKGVSDTSVVSLRDAMSIRSFTMKGEVLKPEYFEEPVIGEDEGSLKHESFISHILYKPVSQRRKPKDPYNDFHTLYGATSYYLPYIRPELQRKSRSREDSLPMYNSTDRHDNKTFYNVSKMIDGFGKSNTKVTPSFANSRFISRPTNVPLNDWVKLGSPGMATNMVPANQAYKTENTKCRFHRLTKLKLHKYGLSATRFLERCDMVEFISKSNTAAKHEKIKSKMEERSQIESRASESSGSLLKSF